MIVRPTRLPGKQALRLMLALVLFAQQSYFCSFQSRFNFLGRVFVVLSSHLLLLEHQYLLLVLSATCAACQRNGNRTDDERYVKVGFSQLQFFFIYFFLWPPDLDELQHWDERVNLLCQK